MLHLIAALDRPTSGIIRVGGVDLASEKDLPGYRRRHIGLVFQLHNLLPQLSAIQNVEVAMFGTGLSLRQRRDRARSLLRRKDHPFITALCQMRLHAIRQSSGPGDSRLSQETRFT